MTTPPLAQRRPHETVHHGITRSDPYAWLRADNWQEVMRDPSALPGDIRDYLEAENAHTAAEMAPTQDQQTALFEEMKGRIKQDDSSVPSPDGSWAYYASYVTGGEYPRICRRPTGAADSDDTENVLLDGNAMGAGLAYFSLGGADHSPDHRFMAYGTDTTGSEYYTLRIRDLTTGEDLADQIPDTGGSAVWAKNSTTLFYTRLDENHRPHAIYRHTLGTDTSADVLVYEEKDPGFFAGVGATQSGDLILIETHTHETSEVWLIDAAEPETIPRLVAAREDAHEYDVDQQGDRLIIRTNRGGAEDFKVCEAPVSAPEIENWKEIEPHRAGRLILGITPYADHLVRLERENGLPRIVITRTSDGETHEIAFDEEAYSLGLGGGYEFDTTRIRFTYSSMTTPSQVFDYDMETRARTLRKTQEVPSGHDPSQYVTRRLMAPAHDGETVPISLLYRKDTPLDGSAPLLLYGYGSYGISMPAGFSTNRLSLVDRGFVYAIAHIRGGREKGHRWYTAGKRREKMNTFRDFISAGEHLIAEKFSSKGGIVAHGGSAGGLLVGAVANMAPELFAGIVAEVPFVDALTTILDDTLPLTPPEWPEWGNPIESADAYADIAAYAPYENVSAQAYPHILALAGLTDPRVTYWEPAKWVARLRANNTSDATILLKTNMDAGHGGASGRFERLHEVALAYAFALKVTTTATA
ncbi:MAG: S9 family peptidase [Pseudomonadota bacterium]